MTGKSATGTEVIPTMCPYGHELGAGRVLVGWAPCTCEPAWSRLKGHRTYQCEACRSAGVTAICYDPPHIPDPRTSGPGPEPDH